MKTYKIVLSLISSAVLLMSWPMTTFAATQMRLPTLNYSEALDCSQGGRTGFFDLTYFNSEVPIGSTVSLRFGFERDDVECRCGSVSHSSWANAELVPMKQWEEFGWFVRINREVACASGAFKLTGIDFVVEVRPPGGNMFVEPILAQGIQTFYRAPIPDISTCEATETSGAQKTCAAAVEWVNGR